MSLSRKHYISLANILLKNEAPKVVIWDIADYLEQDNPRFDRKRFVAASGVD